MYVDDSTYVRPEQMMMPEFELPVGRAAEALPPAFLSDRAVIALRSALQGQIRQPSSELALRRALRALCVEARTRDLRAEQLIVLFKRVWSGLPESRGRDSKKRQELLDRMITICVEEYYAT